MCPDVPEQHDSPTPLEGDPIALGYAQFPDILQPLHFLNLERGMPGIILIQ